MSTRVQPVSTFPGLWLQKHHHLSTWLNVWYANLDSHASMVSLVTSNLSPHVSELNHFRTKDKEKNSSEVIGMS